MERLFEQDPQPTTWVNSLAHSQTSVDAGHSVKPITGFQRRKVFAAIKAYGLSGITCQQLEIVLEMSGNSIRPRIVELMEQGLIEEAGTRPTKSNRQATVYVVKRDA
jgi:hypothetical protein